MREDDVVVGEIVDQGRRCKHNIRQYAAIAGAIVSSLVVAHSVYEIGADSLITLAGGALAGAVSQFATRQGFAIDSGIAAVAMLGALNVINQKLGREYASPMAAVPLGIMTGLAVGIMRGRDPESFRSGNEDPAGEVVGRRII
jgi:hypothetical protein